MQKGPQEAVHILLQLRLKLFYQPLFVCIGDTKHLGSCCHSHPFMSQGQVSLCTEILFIRWLRCALCLASPIPGELAAQIRDKRERVQ